LTSEWFEDVCRSALGHRTSQEATYDIARLVLQRGIPGDFVECGVYAGASCALMAQAIIDAGAEEERCVHLFDTFAGIPKPGPLDTELAGNRGGESSCSIEDVERNMHRWSIPDDILEYWRGDFYLTIPRAVETVGIEQIALLRLDGDLYDSTIVPFEHLYKLVSRGGYIIVDDFDLTGARKAVEHFFVNGIPAPVMWRKS
jgi:O-methyltransferase